jgi:hypothetical protein
MSVVSTAGRLEFGEKMRATRWVDDHWFRGGIDFFGGSALVALAMIALISAPPVTALAFVTLLSSALGLVLSVIGLRSCNPLQWHALVARVQWRLRVASRAGARFRPSVVRIFARIRAFARGA